MRDSLLSNFDPRRSVRELRFWAAWLAGFALISLMLYFCSGMHWPVWDKPALLREQLGGYSLAMPATARTTDATRLAWIRPRYYFRIEMPEADAKAWMDGLVIAARNRGEEASELSAPPALPAPAPPDWFAKPFNTARQKRDRLVQLAAPRSVVWILHQPADGQLFVAVLHR